MLENSSLRAINFEHADDDQGIPSMLEVASQATKVLRRMKKHAETCQCCKEVLESK